MGFSRKSESLRSKRYFWLRDHHFTPEEAREFSKLNDDYPALHRLVASRMGLWASFMRLCKVRGWTTKTERKRQWKEMIVRFYAKQRIKYKRDRKSGAIREAVVNWIVDKDVHGNPLPRPKISPWEWYDHEFQRLPPNLKWDSPRSHRTRQPAVRVDKLMIRRWIEDLKRAIEATADERERDQYRAQIKRLEGSLRYGLRGISWS